VAVESKKQIDMDKQIRNIVFDFGGVIVDLGKERTLESFGALGVDVSGFVGTYGQGGPFAGLETGETAPDVFCREVARLAVAPGGQTEAPLSSERICEAWNRMLVRIPPRRLEALLRLRERYRLFLLSNTNSIHWDYAAAGEDFFGWNGHSPEDFFERIFLSYELHLLKPGEAIFRRLLDEAGLCPVETLFIDDSTANCAAAERLGLRVFCPKEADDWMPLFM